MGMHTDHQRRLPRRPPRRIPRLIGPPERLESRLALTAEPVAPNAGTIVDSQFQPYGYSLIGSQLQDVTTGGGTSLTLTAVNNRGVPPAAPADFTFPQAPVNTGLISASQVNVGGFTTLGLQLQGVTVAGALRASIVDDGIGRPDAGGIQPVPSGGPNAVPALVPAGMPGVVSNAGSITGSQFNDGGFGALGIQASKLSVGGDVSITSRTALGTPDTPIPPRSVAYAPGRMAQPVNAATIMDSQFADGGFGDTGLQLQGVRVTGSLDINAERFVVQPTTAAPNVGPTMLVGLLKSRTTVVTFTKAAPGAAPPTSSLYPGMLVTGQGIAANTVIATIVGPSQITLSKRPLVARAQQRTLTFSAPASPTNTGTITASQFADGGFGDIGLQWQNVQVGGRVATSHSNLSIQPQVRGVSGITVAGRQFGLPPTATPAAAFVPTPSPTITTSVAGNPAPSGGSAGLSASNSGTITSSQFADGGFGDIGMQWQNVSVTGSVEATHNSLSIQPENAQQGLITVANVSFAAAPPSLAPAPGGTGGSLPANPAPISAGTTVGPVAPGGSPAATNAATNSGTIQPGPILPGQPATSQFADGGFGDVGLQWSNVTVRGDVQVVHNSLSVQPQGSALAGVTVKDVVFGSPASGAAGDPRLGPVTVPTLTVKPTGSSGPPPFVPNPAFTKKSNVTPQTNKQLLSSPAAATTLQAQSVRFDGTGLVIVNNVVVVSNTAKGRQAGAVTLSGVTFPGSAPARPISAKPVAAEVPVLQAVGSSGARKATAQPFNAASNSGALVGNQFLDGGTGDIGLQWRDVTINGSVRIEHNSCSVNVVADASGTGPIVVSGIRFDSGWGVSGSSTDQLYLTPAPAAGATKPSAATPLMTAGPGGTGASNSATLTGGQFLDGGMGQIGMQCQAVTINCPLRIVNNVISVTVSGTNTRGVSVQDVTFV